MLCELTPGQTHGEAAAAGGDGVGGGLPLLDAHAGVCEVSTPIGKARPALGGHRLGYPERNRATDGMTIDSLSDATPRSGLHARALSRSWRQPGAEPRSA